MRVKFRSISISSISSYKYASNIKYVDYIDRRKISQSYEYLQEAFFLSRRDDFLFNFAIMFPRVGNFSNLIIRPH